jgi:hypothetical protein
MTEAHPAHSTGGASRDDEGATAALGLAELLCLAATPAFAILALLLNGRDVLAHERVPFGALKLVTSRRSGAGRS